MENKNNNNKICNHEKFRRIHSFLCFFVFVVVACTWIFSQPAEKMSVMNHFFGFFFFRCASVFFVCDESARGPSAFSFYEKKYCD